MKNWTKNKSKEKRKTENQKNQKSNTIQQINVNDNEKNVEKIIWKNFSVSHFGSGGKWMHIGVQYIYDSMLLVYRCAYQSSTIWVLFMCRECEQYYTK